MDNIIIIYMCVCVYLLISVGKWKTGWTSDSLSFLSPLCGFWEMVQNVPFVPYSKSPLLSFQPWCPPTPPPTGPAIIRAWTLTQGDSGTQTKGYQSRAHSEAQWVGRAGGWGAAAGGMIMLGQVWTTVFEWLYKRHRLAHIVLHGRVM